MIAAHLAPFRTILGIRLGRPDQPHVANEQVLLDVNGLAVPDILRLMRLRCLARLMTSAPPQLRQLLDMEGR
eukprot:5971291-Pyramimonas_sp.AAC.1